VGGQGSFGGSSKILNFSVESSIVLSDPDYFDPLGVEYDFLSVTQTVRFFDGFVEIGSQSFQARDAGQLIAGYLPGTLPTSLEQYFADTNQTVFDFGQTLFPQLFSESFFGSAGSKMATLTLTGAVAPLSPGTFFITDPNHPADYFSGETNRDLGTVTAVPEPASWAMMVAGLALAGGWMRRTRMRTIRA
jgi:hypothetical protein